MIAIGVYMGGLPRGPEKGEVIALHKSLGVIALLFVVSRLVWRIKEGPLPPVATMPRWQEIIAKSVQHTLLLTSVLMPLSGIIMNIGGGRALTVFGVELIAAGDKIDWLAGIGHELHHLTAAVLGAALLLHVLGAIKHQVMDKDGTVRRMFGARVN